MSVYVDPLVAWGKRPGWPYEEACHMFADTEDELHALAKKIGLKRAWFQNKKNLPHYDLCPSKRAQAITVGALPVGQKVIAEAYRHNREQNATKEKP